MYYAGTLNTLTTVTSVQFSLFIFLCLNKQNVKKVFYDLYTFQNANTTFNILKTVAKSHIHCNKTVR